MKSGTASLRALLDQDTCHTIPCCWDALSAKMIEQAGFPFTFMSGFAVSAASFGLPDLGLVSYGEMVEQGRRVCSAVDIPVIGDGDTGYGNARNVSRTVEGYERAGFAAIMIEDQVSPKRCGHTKGKQVVGRDEALERIAAAVAARNNSDNGIMILARTDARATHGLDEAIWRVQQFARLGADLLFVEAPQSEDELARVTAEAPGIHMANMLEGGRTPLLPASRLHELGYSFAAYPLTLLSASMRAISDGLDSMKSGAGVAPDKRLDFSQIRKITGFDQY